MNCWRKRVAILAGGLVLGGLCLAGMAGVLGGGIPIDNLRLPLDCFPDGRTKTLLRATHAQMPEFGPVDASNVVVELYDETGRTNITMTAGSCRYDREQGLAASTSDVQIVKEDMRVSGRGFEWNAKTESVRITSRVRVEVDRKTQEGGMRLPFSVRSDADAAPDKAPVEKTAAPAEGAVNQPTGDAAEAEE